MHNCETCAMLRKHYPTDAHLHPMHSTGCAHCGARLIQRVQRTFKTWPESRRREKCRRTLAEWMATGHAESELRALAKAGAWAVAPEPPVKGKN